MSCSWAKPARQTHSTCGAKRGRVFGTKGILFCESVWLIWLGLIMRRVVCDASVALRVSFV